MGKEAQKEWLSLFTADIEDLWDIEPREMRMIIIVHRVLQKEFKRLDLEIKERLKKYNHKIKLAKNLEESDGKDGCLSPTRTSIETITLLEQSPKIKRYRKGNHKKITCSPSLLNNSKDVQNSSSSLLKPVSSFSITQSNKDTPDVIICESDTNEVIDSSILDDRSNISSNNKKYKSSKLKRNLSVNKSNKNILTLTQLLGSNVTKASNDENVDKIGKRRKQVQKDTLFHDYDHIPMTKSKSPEHPHKTEPVRCKADKLKLPGWSCKECEEYYEGFDLSEEELREKMNMCSKHRNKFNPFNETPKGFWDITMFSSQDD